MKLVEKKCPKCGADLSFDKGSKEVICKYCNTSFEVLRDKDDLIDKVSESIDPELINLPAKMFKRASTISTIVFVVLFIIFIIVFIFVASRIFFKF